jgi:hypothetical protein
MKLSVALEMGGRTVCEQLVVPGDTRADFRGAINNIAARLELSTYGPPGPVQEMTAEDKPAGHA